MFNDSVVKAFVANPAEKSELSGYELKHRDSGNTIQFSFFTMQFFPPTQKITKPKSDFHKPRNKNKTLSFCYRLKQFKYAYVIFTKTVLFLLHVHVNCFDTRFLIYLFIYFILNLFTVDC